LSEQTNNKTAITKIVIYTQALCEYCIAAKKLLRHKGVTFTEINVTMNVAKRREMIDRCGQNTVPQIFINDHHIGGYDDMAKLDRHDKLDALLGRN
jgi:glutaredoxin 3